VDPSVQTQAVLGIGRGGLVVTIFGAGWLAWGLSIANAFTLTRSLLFSIVEIVLLGCSGYFIWKGRSLRKKYPSSPSAATRRMNKQFMIVVVLELAAIAIVVVIASALHRPDLFPVLIAIVVGLHFLPLAKVFRTPIYYVSGIAITLWCVLCWILFRSNALIASAGIGTGIMLWATSAYVLLRARHIVRSLEAIS
jgi:hypothetical protein